MQKIDVPRYKLGHPFITRKGIEWLTEKPELIICRECMAFNYNNSWGAKAPSFVGRDADEEILVEIRTCPSCIVRQYEGEDFYEDDSTYVS